MKRTFPIGIFSCVTSLLLLSNCLLAQVVSTTIHPFNYGTGIEGAYTAPAGSSTLSGVHNYTSFTIPAGDTVMITGTTPLVIKCTGTVSINGVLFGRGGTGGNTETGVPGVAGVSDNGGGVNGGEGGMPNEDGIQGVSFGTSSGGGGYGSPSYGAGVGYGGAGGSYGTMGESGIEPAGSVYGDANDTTIMNGTNLLGGSGGGGGGGFEGRAGAGGGGGGGAISITADTIIVSSTGLLTVKGGNGGQMSDNSSSAGGGGGGGSGGTILLQYKSQLSVIGTLNSYEYITATTGIDYSGGKGGIYYVGEWGGAGRYFAQKDTNTNSCVAPALTAEANNVDSLLSICGNTTVTFNANATGGSGCNGSSEYSWSDGGYYWNGASFSSSTALFNTSYNNITAPVSTNGSYLVTIRCSADTACSNTGAVSVNVSAPPSVSSITSGATKCAGDSISFVASATGTPSLTYQWVKNGSPVVGANDSIYFIASLDSANTGNYNVIITGGGACNTTTDSAASPSKLTVNKLPVAGNISTSDDSTCSGTAVTLLLNSSSGTAFQWQSADSTMNFSNINGATSTSYTSTILTELTYFNVIVDNGSCSVVSSPLAITIVLPPVATFTDSIVLNQVFFSTAGSTGSSFSWDFGDGKESNEPDPVHTYANDSAYLVCLTVTNNSNCDEIKCADVVIVSTGINGVTAEHTMQVYPEPVGNTLFVRTNETGSSIWNLEVFDVMGRLLIDNKSVPIQNSPLYLDVSGLAEGVYYLRIKTGDAEFVHEIIKQ